MSSTSGPVARPNRIDSLDVLRGFALLGILVMNIQASSMPDAAYWNPTVYGDLTGANYWVWLLSYVLANRKFYTLFSMLFGAGIFLMTSRAESHGVSSAGRHYRRLGWLVLFGALHMSFLSYVDVLYFYGIVGLVVFLLRKRSPRQLLLLGLASLVIFSVLSIHNGRVLQSGPAETWEDYALEWEPTEEKINEELELYRGDWIGQVKHRFPEMLISDTTVLRTIGFRILGWMLIGMALFKWRWFSAQRPNWNYTALLAATVLTGVPLTLYLVGRNFAAGWDARTTSWSTPSFVAIEWLGVILSLAWISAVMLVCKTPSLNAATGPLAAVGRMAFTNYIMQTVICTTIFYGWGLGYFGHVERVGQLGIVLAIWVFQLIVSPLWLRYFRFGPLEWLWRTLTYWKWQPMRATPTLLQAAPVTPLP